MSDESRMTLRMPTDLYDWIQSDAQRLHNSMNAHVLSILEDYRQRHETNDIKRRLADLESEIAELRKEQK
ncbi:MAG: Arc family DNA-binding protein [Candidatus Competibacteraceae bacterium]|nr:Arc family DNA-binding protein [Candidatus Competibacteraceae bacterium]